MLDLLEGKRLGVGLDIFCRTRQFTCDLVAFAFDDAGGLVEERTRQARVTPWLVDAKQQPCGPLLEL